MDQKPYKPICPSEIAHGNKKAVSRSNKINKIAFNNAKIEYTNEQLYKKVQSPNNYFGKYDHIRSYDSAKARGKI